MRKIVVTYSSCKIYSIWKEAFYEHNRKEKGRLAYNKWVRAAIPALLLHCSIGTVYCWSTFSEKIGEYIGFPKGSVEWAFSFAIFFLGMSAAFLGNVVEKDIHKSSLIASLIVEKFGAQNVAEGYQSVLYVTLALYILSLVLSFVFVRPVKKEEK